MIQDGVPGSYMLAVFKRVAHEESAICSKAVSREAYCSCKVSTVCVASVLLSPSIIDNTIVPSLFSTHISIYRVSSTTAPLSALSRQLCLILGTKVAGRDINGLYDCRFLVVVLVVILATG